MAEIKLFVNSYRQGKVDFSTDPKVLLPKHDFSQVLAKISGDLNLTLSVGDSPLIMEYDVPLIRKVHSKILTDDDWAKKSLQKQREKFLELLRDLGYRCIKRKSQDSSEDNFIMMLRALKMVSWDYTLATFSLIWFPDSEVVTIKFNLSDDWYLEKKERINRYSYPNMDFLINFCSEWNCHSNEYVFVLDVPKEGEAEVGFKANVMKKGDFNLGRALLIAIDKGFIILKALHKQYLFERSNAFKESMDVTEIRRRVKKKLKKYGKSKDFQNLRKQEEKDTL